MIWFNKSFDLFVIFVFVRYLSDEITIDCDINRKNMLI